MTVLRHGSRCWVSMICVMVALAPSMRSMGEEEPASRAEEIAAGERLVHNLDCNVCHSPKVLTPQGPRPDTARLLSGYRASEKLPPLPAGLIGPSGWGGVFNHDLTAWAGPWGVSFASNLTPDAETGIGAWSEGDFIVSLRTGTYVEGARPFLPPMPTYDQLTDEELRAIFAYLRSIPPVANAVPPPLPPQSERPGP